MGISWEQAEWLAGAGLALAGGLAIAGWALRRHRSVPAAAVWATRGLLVGLVLAALARPSWTARTAPGRVIVLVDCSASMPPGWAEGVLRELPRRLGRTELAVFTFAGQAQRMALPMTGGMPRADPADGSDPGPAVRLAGGTLPRGRAPAALLLSDGNWTARVDWPADWPGVWALCPPAGRANAGLASLAAVAVDGGPSPRLLVRTTIAATRDGQATVRLLAIDPTTGQAKPAASPATAQLQARQIRSVDWLVDSLPGQVRVELSADWDELPGDNILTALTPPPAGHRNCLLLTAGLPGTGLTGRMLADLPGWQVVSAVADRPESLAIGLLRSVQPPQVVVLDNLPADGLDGQVLAGLARFVESGGGLLAFGGPNSLAAGGYYDSPLEALLPVRSRPRQRPPAAIVLVLDRSGSMNEPPKMPGGPSSAPVGAGAQPVASKLDLVKQAVLGLPDLFAPADRLAVIGFSDQAKVVCQTEPGRPVDWQQVRRGLLDMPASGGTVIEPALRQAARWLAEQDPPRKHILLLTDGQFADLTVDQAVEILNSALPPDGGRGSRPASQPVTPRLTVSTFAASEQAGPGTPGFLADLARRYDGAFYPPGDWGLLRTRFRDDLAGATVPPTVAGPIQVQPAGNRPALPAIGRMLTSELRDQASAWYRGRDPSGGIWPLVAVAPVGAGRSAVIATSLDAGWADDWSGSSAARTLLAALLDDLAGPGDDPRFALQVSFSASQAESGGKGDWTSAGDRRQNVLGLDLSVRETVPAGRDQPVNLLDLSAVVIDAAARQERFVLPQVGPGRYYGEVPAAGPRRLVILERTGQVERVVLRRLLGPPLAIEFAHLSPRPDRLDRFCRAHGGRLLDSLDQLSQMPVAPAEQQWALWPALLLAACACWLADLMLSHPVSRPVT